MPNAKLRKKRVNRAHLNAGATTAVAQRCSVDVILPVRAEKWQGGKALDDVLARSWSSEPLKQFLQNEPRNHDNLVTLEGIAQRAHLRDGGNLVAPQSK